MQKAISIVPAILLLCSPVQSKPFHNEISKAFRGTWAPNMSDCRAPNGENIFSIDSESINYYEGNDYLLLGIEFFGATTKPNGSGTLFNGRFTSRIESNLVGESNIRLEVDDRDKDVLYRYPIGEDGEPVAARKVKSVRCS